MSENYPKVRDYFSRINTDGWSALDSGQNWKLSFDNTNLSSGYPRFKANTNSVAGSLTMTTADSATYNHAVYADGAALSTQDEVLMKFAVSSTTYGFGVVLGRASHNSWYAVAVRNGNELTVWAKDSNVTSGTIYPNLVRVAFVNPTYSTNTYYWLRARRTATNIQGKLWQAGTSEPASWTIDTPLYDGVQKPGAGNAGLWFKGGATNGTITIDTFLAYHSASELQPNTDVTTDFDDEKYRGLGDTPSGHVWEGDLTDTPQPYANTV
jgi:hypothetical protein